MIAKEYQCPGSPMVDDAAFAASLVGQLVQMRDGLIPTDAKSGLPVPVAGVRWALPAAEENSVGHWELGFASWGLGAQHTDRLWLDVRNVVATGPRLRTFGEALFAGSGTGHVYRWDPSGEIPLLTLDFTLPPTRGGLHKLTAFSLGSPARAFFAGGTYTLGSRVFSTQQVVAIEGTTGAEVALTQTNTGRPAGYNLQASGRRGEASYLFGGVDSYDVGSSDAGLPGLSDITQMTLLGNATLVATTLGVRIHNGQFGRTGLATASTRSQKVYLAGGIKQAVGVVGIVERFEGQVPTLISAALQPHWGGAGCVLPVGNADVILFLGGNAGRVEGAAVPVETITRLETETSKRVLAAKLTGLNTTRPAAPTVTSLGPTGLQTKGYIATGDRATGRFTMTCMEWILGEAVLTPTGHSLPGSGFTDMAGVGLPASL